MSQPENHKKDFGKLLTSLRKRRGISQKDLASILCVSPSAVSKWEHGNNLPDVAMYHKIAEALQISLNDLHYPEEALQKLETIDQQSGYIIGLEDKQTEIENSIVKTSRRKSVIKDGVYKGLLLYFMVLIAVIVLFRMQGVECKLVAERYTYNEAMQQEIYEMAFVVKGDINSELIDRHLIELHYKYSFENIPKDVNYILVYYYLDKKSAINWLPSEAMAGLYVDDK